MLGRRLTVFCSLLCQAKVILGVIDAFLGARTLYYLLCILHAAI